MYQYLMAFFLLDGKFEIVMALSVKRILHEVFVAWKICGNLEKLYVPPNVAEFA